MTSIFSDYVIGARVSERQYEKLIKYCRERNITVSQFIRECINKLA